MKNLEDAWAEVTGLNIEQMLEACNLKRGRDTSRNTYLYVAMDGRLTSTEKADRHSAPADEYAAIGYVASFARA